MRTPVVAGNWKMNPPTLEEALALARSARDAAANLTGVTAVICPPTVWLADVRREVAGGRLEVGAQTMHDEERGAFTGETSPPMLAGLATFVIIGHSERRQYNAETDESVRRKVASAVAHGLRRGKRPSACRAALGDASPAAAATRRCARRPRCPC